MPFASAAQFTAGQTVEVRSAAEIAATLDADGKLDGIPFMPEMAAFCGRRMRIFRRGDKMCVEGVPTLRRFESIVLLDEVRCNGAAHDGCQRNCLILWKEAWLKPVEDVSQSGTSVPPADSQAAAALARLPTRNGQHYLCQSTALAQASSPVEPWTIVAILRDIARGELPPVQFLRIAFWVLINRARRLVGYEDRGTLRGAAPKRSRGDLDLQPGEWVEVKSLDEIRSTLDANGNNLGLHFDHEMIIHAGKHYQVDFPVRKIVHEATGKLIPIKNTVALKGVSCLGLCAQNCPRRNTIYWREAWLKRVPSGQNTPER